MCRVFAGSCAARRAGVVLRRLRCAAARFCRWRITAAVHAAHFIALLCMPSSCSQCVKSPQRSRYAVHASIRTFCSNSWPRVAKNSSVARAAPLLSTRHNAPGLVVARVRRRRTRGAPDAGAARRLLRGRIGGARQAARRGGRRGDRGRVRPVHVGHPRGRYGQGPDSVSKFLSSDRWR